MSDRQQREALEAKRLADDPTFVRLVEELQARYHREWLADAATPEARERLWAKAVALRDLQDELRVQANRVEYANQEG